VKQLVPFKCLIPVQKTMTRREELFGVKIDAIEMSQSVAQLMQWSSEPRADKCRFVVTPNVDHTVILQENAALRAAYVDAALVLADGHPVVWAARLLGRPLPGRVPGSDLVPRLFSAANAIRPLRVFLLGAAEGVAQRAAEKMREQWPAVQTVGCYSPPMGFEKDAAEETRILEMIADCKPDVLIVGLGAPKQELWVHKHQHALEAKVALCVGATIDFLAGEKRRAPRWIQSIGLEWMHRMCSEPKRLVKRYARDAFIFPQLVFRQWRLQSRQR
jgi:N-acetylglucosaminyldiphosphoundecaprenol N-acetyl-beta-D-mannosaminyltransferase